MFCIRCSVNIISTNFTSAAFFPFCVRFIKNEMIEKKFLFKKKQKRNEKQAKRTPFVILKNISTIFTKKIQDVKIAIAKEG